MHGTNVKYLTPHNKRVLTATINNHLLQFVIASNIFSNSPSSKLNTYLWKESVYNKCNICFVQWCTHLKNKTYTQVLGHTKILGCVYPPLLLRSILCLVLFAPHVCPAFMVLTCLKMLENINLITEHFSGHS